MVDPGWCGPEVAVPEAAWGAQDLNIVVFLLLESMDFGEEPELQC